VADRRAGIADLLARLAARPRGEPALIAPDGAPNITLDGPALADAVERLSAELLRSGVRVLATLLDNGSAWVVADLAALRAGIVHVPLPAFFTPAQREHALRAAGVDAMLTPAALPGFDTTQCDVAGAALCLGTRAATPARLPDGTAKVTFTSGTTGTPKGVCLSADAMLAVARGLAEALAPLAIERHMVALPLPVLLENLAGIYAPLWHGASVVVPPLAAVGIAGSSTFDPAVLDAAVRHAHAHSVITLPQMLRAWTAWRTATAAGPGGTLRFVAVGGAAAGSALIAAARAAGLPAYEGYGLSEGASVQTLNLPGADRPGSVGRALPHARIRVDGNGEIRISGTPMLGYAGEPARSIDDWPTGDLGEIDADGFVHVRGRRKNVLITGFGRNVSPEWIETALRSLPLIAHAVVFGDGAPALSAVIWPSRADLDDSALDAAIAAANAQLPDYARVRHWVRARAPFALEVGTCTANGRPLRIAIEHIHAAALAAAQTRTIDVVQ
jgi:long-subunit acyl-CoA synthetase (AMP-forming)